jgi:hypothetical protein
LSVICDRSAVFSLGTTASSTNKTDRHDITEILLKVALNTITLTHSIKWCYTLLYYECQNIPRKYPLYNVFGVIVYNVTCVTNGHGYVLCVDTNYRSFLVNCKRVCNKNNMTGAIIEQKLLTIQNHLRSHPVLSACVAGSM